MEYELVEGRELALTLLRSIGLISRSAHRYRKVPAGPELAQLERYRHPFLTATGTGPGELREERGPELSGEGVVLSSLRSRNGALEARLVNESPKPVIANFGRAELRLGAWEVRTVEI